MRRRVCLSDLPRCLFILIRVLRFLVAFLDLRFMFLPLKNGGRIRPDFIFYLLIQRGLQEYMAIKKSALVI
jgi:hypothetical protein